MNGISITDVSYQINDTAILSAVSFQSDAKRIAILGRNGSGKSTLSRLICGIDRPNQGEIRINDIDVYADRRAALNTVGMIFQNPDHQIIFPTVGEELRFGLTQLGLSKNEADFKVNACLKEYNKLEWFDRSISTLSQGQKHLVCLLSVLLMKPKVLLLDEPFTGIDIPTQRKLEEYLRPLNQTVVLVSHVPETFENYERLIWMDEGGVQADGTPRGVIKKYQDAMYKYREKNI